MLEKDIDHLLTYYDDDAIWLLANMPILREKDAIRNNWTNWFKTPDSSLSWKPIKVEVSKSGDLAYSFGTYDIQYNNKEGERVSETGGYVAVWKKNPDLEWKLLVDSSN